MHVGFGLKVSALRHPGVAARTRRLAQARNALRPAAKRTAERTDRRGHGSRGRVHCAWTATPRSDRMRSVGSVGSGRTCRRYGFGAVYKSSESSPAAIRRSVRADGERASAPAMRQVIQIKIPEKIRGRRTPGFHDPDDACLGEQRFPKQEATLLRMRRDITRKTSTHCEGQRHGSACREV